MCSLKSPANEFRHFCSRAACLLVWAVASPVVAGEFVLPDSPGRVVGQVEYTSARQQDTLSDIARAHNLGYLEIRNANPKVDPWLPGEGTTVLLPNLFVLPATKHEGLVLNRAEYRLYYYPPAKGDEARVVMTYPMSVGREGWETPLGVTRITAKVSSPSWYPPKSIKEEHALAGDPLPDVVPPGPENPLGTHAIRLGIPGYLIHGTNKPYGVGMKVSHGCIRLYPEDIETLFERIPTGTSVTIVDEPIKAGWRDGQLFLESHLTLSSPGTLSRNDLILLERAVVEASTHLTQIRVDWDLAVKVAAAASGIPVVVGDLP